MKTNLKCYYSEMLLGVTDGKATFKRRAILVYPDSLHYRRSWTNWTDFSIRLSLLVPPVILTHWNNKTRKKRQDINIKYQSKPFTECEV